MGSCKPTPPKGILDRQLIHKAETSGSGTSVHRMANYLASYISLGKLYAECNGLHEDAILEDFHKAEHRLRILVNKH